MAHLDIYNGKNTTGHWLSKEDESGFGSVKRLLTKKVFLWIHPVFTLNCYASDNLYNLL